MAFEITANKLERDSEIKVLKLESEEYSIKIFYYGDYKKDMEAGKCLAENLSMVSKPKRAGFPLSFMGGMVVMEVPSYPVVLIEDVEGLKNSLDMSKEAAMELQEVFLKYFNIKPQ